MPFSSLIGNERIKKLLQRAVTEGRVSQSLMMAGPRGVGKYQFAVALAQALNCERVTDGDACGDCVPCRKVRAGEHADVQTVVNDGQFIKIEQMRGMLRDAQFKPYEGRHRVCIIDEADRMNAPSANSILKTLEEPPASTLIVLVTAKPYGLPETIRSRCQMLSFSPLAADEIEAQLRLKLGATAEEARLRAQLSRGSIGRAMEIDPDEYREMRGRVLEILETLATSRDTAKLLGEAEYLGRRLEKDEFEAHLDTLMVLLADVFYLKLGREKNSIGNADVADQLTRVAQSVSVEQIADWASQIEEIFEGLTRNVNRQLAMDAMLIG